MSNGDVVRYSHSESLVKELTKAEKSESTMATELASIEGQYEIQVAALERQIVQVKRQQVSLQELVDEKDQVIKELQETIESQQKEIFLIQDEAKQEVEALKGVISRANESDYQKSSPRESSFFDKPSPIIKNIESGDHFLILQYDFESQQKRLLTSEEELIKLKQLAKELESKSKELESSLKEKDHEIEKLQIKVKTKEKELINLQAKADEKTTLLTIKAKELELITSAKSTKPENRQEFEEDIDFKPEFLLALQSEQPTSYILGQTLEQERVENPSKVLPTSPTSKKSVDYIGIDDVKAWQEYFGGNSCKQDISMDRLKLSPQHSLLKPQMKYSKQIDQTSKLPPSSGSNGKTMLRIPISKPSPVQKKSKIVNFSLIQRAISFLVSIPVSIFVCFLFSLFYLLGIGRQHDQQHSVKQEKERTNRSTYLDDEGNFWVPCFFEKLEERGKTRV